MGGRSALSVDACTKSAQRSNGMRGSSQNVEELGELGTSLW
jgi:hypothetical protein